MSTAALIIVFNHNYEDNIDKLLNIYTGRFKNIWFVMPFYEGSRKDVISVYYSSYYFQGFVATAINHLKFYNFDYYLTVADDLYLNPKINENNYQKYFKIDERTGFISNFFDLNSATEKRPSRPYAPFWNAILSALNLQTNKGFEWSKYLPSRQEAFDLFEKHGIKTNHTIKAKMLFPFKPIRFSLKIEDLKFSYHGLKLYLSNFKYLFSKRTLIYPMVGGYSDIAIIPKSAATDFAKYAHTFASLNLFVEIAFPTALLLACENLTTEDDLDLKCVTYWYPESLIINNKNYGSISEINSGFPEDALYVHPIKLSKIKSLKIFLESVFSP